MTKPENRQAQRDKFWILKTYYLHGIKIFSDWFANRRKADKLFIETNYRESDIEIKVLDAKNARMSCKICDATNSIRIIHKFPEVVKQVKAFIKTENGFAGSARVTNREFTKLYNKIRFSAQGSEFSRVQKRRLIKLIHQAARNNDILSIEIRRNVFYPLNLVDN